MTVQERAETLRERRLNGRPWHSVPHRHSATTSDYLFTAACFSHQSFIGHSKECLSNFEKRLIACAEQVCDQVVAWVVLPNHYHFLAQTFDAVAVTKALGRLHGSTSFEWNREEDSRGRQVWAGAAETAMKSDRHFWATTNYIHHNPIKHGYATKWQDWPWSSASTYLDNVGQEQARKTWREYPINDYGKGWDD